MYSMSDGGKCSGEEVEKEDGELLEKVVEILNRL